MSLMEIEYFDKQRKLCRSELDKGNGWEQQKGIWKNADLKLELSLEVKESPEKCQLTIPIGSLVEAGSNKVSSIIIKNGFLDGVEGDDAEFILPCDTGVSCSLCNKSEGEYILPGFSASNWPEYVMNMLMAAKVTPSGSKLMIIDDCRFDSGFRLRTNYGTDHLYQLDAMFGLRRKYSDQLPEDSPSIICCDIDGGLSETAKYYRNYIIKRLEITPLKEKFALSKAMRESAESVMIRLRMATKPVPSPVEEQTQENQPEVRKLMDFDDAVKLAEECSKQNIEDIDFTFVGWNYGGHDGAFPQIFPVEEKLGGRDAMIRAVNRLKELGYKVSIHDNLADSYTLANNLDHADWAIDSEGNVINGEIWGGGRAHLLCPQRALEQYVPDHFNSLEPFDLNGAYYVDVISLNNLYSCTSPEHPLSLKESAGFWKKVLLKQRDFSGVAMSEGAREWALPEVDRVYAATNRPNVHTELSFADKTIPLFPIIFHGLVLYNSCRMTINAMPGEPFYLDNIALGGLPLLYFYQRFQENTSTINRGSDDLTITTSEKLSEDVAKIKRIAEDIKLLVPLQTEYINDYKTLGEGIICVDYENGAKLYVNYTDKEVVNVDGTVVPPKDFTLTRQEKIDENMYRERERLSEAKSSKKDKEQKEYCEAS